ncbi:MAG: hypothetical protein Q8K75_07860 [Chlamydiales bacterium]|nr:hypothetical protein [Chlamydiales bacterium]
MYCKKRTLLFIAGSIWFGMGLYLMIIGMGFLEVSLAPDVHAPLLTSLENLFGARDITVVLLVALALVIGQIKGRTVLTKAALRQADRILSLPEPTHIKNLFSGRFYVLMAIMMGLGIGMKYFGVPLDIRGAIDVTVGVALIQGAVAYYKQTATAPSHL